MGKKKKEEKNKKEFNIEEAFKTVNPFMLDGFKRYIMDKDVKSEEEFKNYLEEYGGC